jgi:peptide/nickel transport system substrate-binding protein
MAAGAGELVVGLQLEPPTLDPTSGAAAAIKDVAFQTLYEGLVRLGPGGEVRPWLATGWTVSPDGLTYRFRLRPGVRFHDGAPFDAEAVRFSLDRARASTSTNSQKARFGLIAEIATPDPLTVEVKLKRRSSTFLQVLGWGDAAILSPRSAATDATAPVGTGPFRFQAWRRGEDVSLVRNPAYWGAEPHVARLRFRFLADPTAAEAALKAGDVDAFPAFPAPEAVSALARDPRFVVRVGPSEGETLLAINERSGPLADLRVRRALDFAIDRRAVIQGAMSGYGQPIGSHYPPQDPGYVDLTGLYPHDPAHARALLAQAGYPHGLDLTLKLPPPAYARRSGEIIAAELAQAGVRVRIEDVEWAQWLADVFGRHDYQLTIVSHVEPLDYDIYGRDDYYFGDRSAAA